MALVIAGRFHSRKLGREVRFQAVGDAGLQSLRAVTHGILGHVGMDVQMIDHGHGAGFARQPQGALANAAAGHIAPHFESAGADVGRHLTRKRQRVIEPGQLDLDFQGPSR